MKKTTAALLLGLFTLFVVACGTAKRGPSTFSGLQADTSRPLTRITFGSCSDASKPVHAFELIAELKPDLMIFLGDNVYADTTDETKLRAAYQELADNADFQKLAQACPILATWDDHDYGINDAGVEHPAKAMSQQVFLDFWGVPKDSPRRDRQGVYDAQTFGPPGQRVQVILLDTRYHRSPLTKRSEQERLRDGGGPYKPNPDPSLTMLGEEQWRWLEKQLKQPAELRLIASSVQVIAEDHNWEGWAMMPRERTRLFELIRDTGANGVIFLSGDRHHAELSFLDDGVPYRFYDVTSSSFNKPGNERDETNRHRASIREPMPNYGMITIAWDEWTTFDIDIVGMDNITRGGDRYPLDKLSASYHKKN